MTKPVPYIVGKHQKDQTPFVSPPINVRRLSGGREKEFYSACQELSSRAWNDAEMKFSQIVAKYPDFQDARYLLSALQIRRGHWQRAHATLLPLTGKEYFIGYWVFRFLPDFRLVMKADADFWLTIIPRTEELLIAMSIIKRNLGEPDTCMAISRIALEKFQNHIGLKVFLAAQLIRQERYEEAIRLLNVRLTKRYDDLGTIYRFLRGYALAHLNDIASGIYQMQSALDFAHSASPYLKENIKYRIFETLVKNGYYYDAVHAISKLNPSVADNLPEGFDYEKTKLDIREKMKTLADRGLELQMSLEGFKRHKSEEEDFWEVRE